MGSTVSTTMSTSDNAHGSLCRSACVELPIESSRFSTDCWEAFGGACVRSVVASAQSEFLPNPTCLTHESES